MAGQRRSSGGTKQTQRLNLQVGVEAVERLLIHSIKAKVSPGELVTQLIELHLRQWKVQSNAASRTTQATVSGSEEIAGQASESEAAAA